MKYFIFVLIVVVNSLCALAQSDTHARQHRLPDNETVLGYVDQYDSLPKLHFTVASQDEYNKLPQNSCWTNPSLKVNKGYFLLIRQ